MWSDLPSFFPLTKINPPLLLPPLTVSSRLKVSQVQHEQSTSNLLTSAQECGVLSHRSFNLWDFSRYTDHPHHMHKKNTSRWISSYETTREHQDQGKHQRRSVARAAWSRKVGLNRAWKFFYWGRDPISSQKLRKIPGFFPSGKTGFFTGNHWKFSTNYWKVSKNHWKI